MTKFKISDLKTYLSTKTENGIVEEILTLTKTFPVIQEYYASKFSGDDNQAVLEKYRKIIKNQLFPDKGDPKLQYSVARKAIADFKKVSSDPYNIAELMLSYVEYGILTTKEFGDIDEPFYNSMESMYQAALKFIKKNNIQDAFKGRCEQAVEDTKNMGWGFGDSLKDMFYTHFE